jgi:predicted Zn-dependent peptidase
MTVRELRDFLESHYTPDRAILTLTGDFDARRAQALLVRYFGSLPARAARPGQKPAATVTPTNPALALTAIAPSLIGEVRLKVAARVELPSVALYWPTVPFYEPGDAELDLVAELLVGRRAGWLRWKLIDELKIATGVWAHQASHALGSEFQIYATATPGHTPTELANAIDSVLRTLQSDPPNDHSFSGTLAGFLFDRALATEQNSVAANMYADCEDQGVRSGCVRFLFSRYTAVDAQRLSAVAAQALPLGRRVVVEVTPASDAPIAGELRSRSVVPE